MFFLFIFFIFFQVIYGYNHKNCTVDKHPNWLCNYMQKHGKVYSGHAELNLRKIKLTAVEKKSDHNVEFGLTSRSDRFNHELKRNIPMQLKHHKNIKRSVKTKHLYKAHSRLPPIDWRSYRGVPYVTEVKDQGECGDCFAFSSATVLEFWSKMNGFPKSLSTQTIMDCTSGPEKPDVGCEGGLMEYVFEYAKHHPITLEQNYPYLDEQSVCPHKQLWSHVNVKDYKVLMISENSKTEETFETILHNYGPIGVGIDSKSMDNYKGGIFKADMCTTEIDHAVAIVGYTESAWIIKNSWGKNWGDNGYLYLERGKNACGIAEYVVYISNAHSSHRRMSTHWRPDFSF
tara:strand:+ start:9515 stop:10546 length:1032 start_codon:yes stop_codon:yes gene_type:complete